MNGVFFGVLCSIWMLLVFILWQLHKIETAIRQKGGAA